MAGVDLVRAYHREEADPGEHALDVALGLPSREERYRDSCDETLANRFPGHSTVDVATPYVVCRGLFTTLQLAPDDVFIDLGCGSGRVVIYGAVVSPATFCGVELVEARVESLRRAVRRAQLTRVDAIVGDVLEIDWGAGTVFYAFRPFSEAIQLEVVERLHREAARRDITVVTHRMHGASFRKRVFVTHASGSLSILRSRT